MRAIFETAFDIFYLITVITVGIKMIKKADANQYKLFGIMAVVLGCGDAFHLVPRMIALNSANPANYVAAMGIGKLITSVTMTIFYVILYKVWVVRYNPKKCKFADMTIYLLAAIRIILCFFPQNQWTAANPSVTWGIIRNIPFTILGILIIIIFFKSARVHNDSDFKNMWLTILLSFGFYTPVVLFAEAYPLIGLLMIPKTCAYLWTVFIGYNAMKKELA